MKYKTSITKIEEGVQSIRGNALLDLVRDNGFVASIYLLLNKKLPTEAESRMFNAMLTAVIDHGPGTPSAQNARVSASAKNPLHASVAAGLLGLGDRHGTVVEHAMNFFYAVEGEEDLEEFLKEMKERKEYVMGYGHKIFTDIDPRAGALFEIAKEVGIYGKHCEFAERVGETLNNISSRALPMNADGAIAAILCDMGLDARIGNGIFVIGRVPGLVAHIVEERTNDTGIRRIPQEDIEYAE